LFNPSSTLFASAGLHRRNAELNQQNYAEQTVLSNEFAVRFPLSPANAYVEALFASPGCAALQRCGLSILVEQTESIYIDAAMVKGFIS
jgi:hypothetical protein